MEDFEEVKKLISSILISSPLQMTVYKLNRDFAEQIGCFIPYGKLGFQSLNQCLASMSDVLKLRGDGMHAEIIVHVSDKTAHIDKLIANQKTKRSRKPNFSCGSQRRAPPRRIRSSYYTDQIRLENTQLPRSRLSYTPESRHSSPILDGTPLMHHSVPIPLNLMASPSYSSSSHSQKQQETSYQQKDAKSPKQLFPTSINTRTSILRDDLGNSNQVPHTSNNTYVTDSLPRDCYSQLGAIPKESSINVRTSLQADEQSDIYSSDEEEVVNYRVPLKVQEHLQNLIDKYEDGVWCSKIPQVYQQMFKKTLDYQDYGYKSLIQMCMDLKSIFFWYRPDRGDFKLYDRRKPIPNDLDKHYKHSDFIQACGIMSTQSSDAPAVVDVEDLIDRLPTNDYPPDVVHLMEELPRQFISSSDEEYVDVCVGEVYDPSKFWVMLTEFTPLLDQLMDDMQDFYQNCPELKIPPDMIQTGLYCAAVYNHEYHRAIIVKLMRNQETKVKVFYIDYGTVNITLVSDLHFLHKKFFNLPQQAIRARLARIYPPVADTLWPMSTSSRFLEMITMKNLVAHLDFVDVTQQILHVFLVDTSGDDDVYMNDALVNEGYAIFTHEEQKPSQSYHHYVPCVKFLHLFPTFDELEQGVAPNSSEMIRLERFGMEIEHVLPQYFTRLQPVTGLEVTEKSEKTKTKKSSVVARRLKLQSLVENAHVEDELNLSDSSSAYSDTAKKPQVIAAKPVEIEPLPEELIVAKPAVRPPPGFEGIHEQNIKIMTQSVNGGLVNTVVTQSMNIGSANTSNILNYLFQDRSVQQNQTPQPVQPNTKTAIVNQLLLGKILGNQILMNNYQQAQQNPYAHQPVYTNQTLFNTIHSTQQHNYSGATNYNQGSNLLRTHLQNTIKEALLTENRTILNRLLLIIKKRSLTPGVHQGLFSIILEIIDKPVAPEVRDNIFKEVLNFLNDDDIIDLEHEVKLNVHLNTAPTQHSNVAEIDELFDNLKLNTETKNNTNNVKISNYDNTTIISDQINHEMSKLVVERDFKNHKLHILNLEIGPHIMVTEILQLLDIKMPIERVRKCIIMTGSTIAILDLRLQDYRNLSNDLSKYIVVDGSGLLPVVPISLVPRVINILGNRKDLARDFDNFLKEGNVYNNTRYIS